MSNIIELTRFNNKKFMLNDDLIESIEETPDTIITLVSGKRFVVKESSFEVRNEIIKFRRKSHLVFEND